MAWQEVPSLRRRHAKTWHDPDTQVFHTTCRLASMHYPSRWPDNPVDDTPIDLTPQRVQTAELDGWVVTQNGWQYALGQRGGTGPDGWVGHRSGPNETWVWARLVRLGYLHWPTRTWQDIGGAPTYARANLSQAPQVMPVGPAEASETMTLASLVTWTGLWTTPGGGRVDLQWRVQGQELKEELVCNQAARTWLAANRPPTTPLTETWFGGVFEMDAPDVARWIKGGAVQAPGSDFEDGGESLRMEDVEAHLVGFLPASKGSVPRQGATPGVSVPLRKRLWHEGPTQYLLVGMQVSVLNTLPAGPLILDPTFTVAETAEDASSEILAERISDATSTYGAGGLAIGGDGGSNLDGAWIFRGTGITSGATILTATVFLTLFFDSGAVTGDWWGFAVDSPADFTNAHTTHRVSDHETRTSASVADGLTTGANHTTPSLVAIVQEIVNRPGFTGDLGLTWRNTGGVNYWMFVDYTNSAVNAAQLTVTWTGTPTTQAGYQWANDAGSALAAQDTPITRAPTLATRLRTLVDTTGSDPPPMVLRLEYRKKASGHIWRVV